MYTLDTISTNVIAFSQDMNIKITDTLVNIVVELSRNGRNSFTADDIVYIINNRVKATHNKVTVVQITRALNMIVRENARGEYRYGMRRKAITRASDFYFYGV